MDAVSRSLTEMGDDVLGEDVQLFQHVVETLGLRGDGEARHAARNYAKLRRNAWGVRLWR